MPPKKSNQAKLKTKPKDAPPKQENALPDVSFHLYLRRYFHVVARDNNYVSRISKEAVERLNIFLNEFIAHITRSGCKIVRDDGRKTLLDRDIDAVFYVILEASEYRGSKRCFNDALRDFKEFMEDPYHKMPSTLGDKYDLLVISPTRVLRAMKETEPEIRISELAVIRLSAFMNEMFDVVFRAAMGRNIVRKKDDKKHTRLISWEAIKERLRQHVDYKISYCRFEL